MLLVLDGNNLAWAGYYALERAMKPESDERRARVAMLGLASTVLGAIARDGCPPNTPPGEPVTRVAICFDEGRPLSRRSIYPPYQTGRERDPKFMANEDTVVGAISAFCGVAERTLPVDVLRGVNTEADDLVAGLVDRHGGERPLRIVSTDRDFLQLISPTVSVYAPVKRMVVDERNFYQAMFPKLPAGQIPFPRDRFLDYRALVGDASDNVAGVNGVGEQSAVRLLAAAPLDRYFGDVAAVRAALGRKSAAVESAFADGSAREIVERNRKLMDLRRPAACWEKLDELTTRGTWNRPAFERWFADEKISAVEPESLFRRLESLAAA
ncbi:MAG: hypothetical protein HYX50_01805 [Chloroflexi bacterium]|nr:hypothetical protein [Chloroflexota bacterium]